MRNKDCRARCERQVGTVARAHRQSGAVLIIGLILLVVLAMIGMTGMQTTTQQERMAGNMRDRNIGFQSAESALRIGELQVENGVAIPLGSGFYDSTEGVPAPSPDVLAQDSAWTAGNSVVLAAVTGSHEPPAYKIERRPPIPLNLGAGEARTQEVFTVTARGVGASEAAVVVLQSSYLP